VSLVTPDVVLRAIPREPSYDIRAVGQKLRADLIVTGSFQRVEDQMRIMSRVLDVPTGEILFTSKLNGEWSHIFDLQDRVVTELLSGLRFKASSSEVAPILSPDTIHLEAYEQYAEGKRLFHRPGRSNLDEAKQRFERALALDPGYAAVVWEQHSRCSTFAVPIRTTFCGPSPISNARFSWMQSYLNPIPFWPMPVGGKERLSWHERWARKPSADNPT
jgi:hypothetical protein